MVNQNFVLYVNSKKILKAVPLDVTNSQGLIISFCIPEEHLICGLIIQGVPIKGEKLRNFPLKPIEKYLFEFSNIHFLISQNQYTVENSCYQWFLDLLQNDWIQSTLQDSQPLYDWQILSFQRGKVSFTAPAGMNVSQAFRLVQSYDDGEQIQEYFIVLENCIFDEFSRSYEFYINSPYTGLLKITDSMYNQVSNLYAIPQ